MLEKIHTSVVFSKIECDTTLPGVLKKAPLQNSQLETSLGAAKVLSSVFVMFKCIAYADYLGIVIIVFMETLFNAKNAETGFIRSV